jgi:spore maturation protein CgeB
VVTNIEQSTYKSVSAFDGKRVLIIGKSLAPDCMESHVLQTLADMGCVTQCIAGDGHLPQRGSSIESFLQKAREQILSDPDRRHRKQLLKAVAEFAPSLILVIQGNFLPPESVAALRSVTRSAIVCWCQDQISAYGRQYILGCEYDAVFVKDRFLQQLFSQAINSTRFHYLAEACNPRVHRPVSITDEEMRRMQCDVLMLGSLYYYRQEILRQLTDFDLRIYGAKPKWLLDRLSGYRKGGDLVLDQKAKAIRAAKISLNTLHCAEINGLNCRAFELAGCGAFQLTSYRDVMNEHFVAGTEIESFKTTTELREKIAHYLKNPEQAAAIALRGQERAHREHTYEQRLSVILNMFA